MADIKETGPVGLKGLKGLNQQKDISDMSLEEQWQSINSIPRTAYSSAPEESVGLEAMQAGYGNSQYDEGITSASQFGDIGDIRYANQPWYDTLANGVGKMLGTAGTTFVSSLVGLPYGLYEAANQGRWSALWDNDVTQGLANVDNWLEENMTNYRSQVQQNSPWYSPDNLFSMNFIADDVIKNAGFTLGAAASMAIGSGSLGLMSKALGFVNDVGKGTKMGQAALSALFSATGEGMIEARQGVEERNKLEMQKLEDSLAPEKQALEMEFNLAEQEYASNRGKTLVRGYDGTPIDPAYEKYKQQLSDLAQKRDILNQKYEAGKQQIWESGQEMGNKILLANQGLLTLGNLIQFGKGMVKSFDSARHAAEVSSKAAKPFGAWAERVADGTYKVGGKNLGRTIAATKGILTEGSEEMNQQWIQSSAGTSVNEADINDYWKAKMDPESYRETTKGLYTMGQILDRGFNESWGDIDQWEQFVVGGLTGMAGSYSPTKLFNQDKTRGRLDPRRYGSWEGGAYNEVRDFNEQYAQYQENIDEVNKILQSEDFPARVRSMVGHTYTQNEKDAAAETDDKKAWKDADDKQNIHDIQSFLRAGKLDDLRAIYEEIGKTVSDEDIENVVKSTTKEITAEEDKQNHDRLMDERIAMRQREVDSLYDELESLQNGLLGSTPDVYNINRDYVNKQSSEILQKIDRGEGDIAALQQEKEQYIPQKYYEGAYVDRQGNRIYSDDEIRETLKHNSEELNKKLDSYLESIDYVNRRTNGQLTKDREDNLAYLHNMGKLSHDRMQKIMADVRRQMPSKFLLKTNKTPEQLTQENASSNLVFSKDENTKEGYVEVDTSLMNDAAFADFFQREVMRGGNINPEFAETADEKQAREEDEKNLSEEERKKRAKERASRKWDAAIKKMQEEAKEQRDVNWRNLVDNFMENYKRDNNATLDETIEAFREVEQNLIDAAKLFNQAGEFEATLQKYMANPSLVDKDKEVAEAKAEKTEATNQAENKFAGKDARQMKQEMAEGVMDEDEFSDFANMDLSGDAPAPLVEAQQEAKKVQETNQKAAALKNHIQENLGDNPTSEELNAAQIAMQMVDNVNLEVSNPEDFSINNPAFANIPLNMVDPNASDEEIDNLNNQVQGKLAEAFTELNEDEDAQSNIPEENPIINDVEAPTTGNDEITKSKPQVVAPEVSLPSKAANNPIPKNPLTEGAIGNIIKETSNVTTPTNTNGTWRSTTTRHPYGKSTGTYHDTITDKNSIQYKRSKAIWEYLNSEGAFDRMDNASEDRIKPKDTIHFMVKYLPEVVDKELGDMTTEERNASLVIIMMNDNGEVVGDLPLADFEPSFRNGNPTQQVKDLMALQDKVFDAFMHNYSTKGSNEAIVDNILHKDGVDNLNLTFSNAKKSPLVSRIKQVMRGAVPYRYGEFNTLNEVAQGNLELGVKVTGTTVAMRRGDKIMHKEIVVPNVGTTGQPYMLLPTASGEKIAVPFYMPIFNAEQHRNTELYKMLSNAVYYVIANNSLTTDSQKEEFNKHIDVIEGLLQVERQPDVRTVEVRSDSVILHLQSLTDPNQKYDLSVSNNGTTADVAKALVNTMSGIPVNVSLQFLNDKIETGEKGEVKYTRNYNEVIGEIANVNLPKATKHTVNSWFTVELTTQAGVKPSKQVTPKTMGTIIENIGGRNIEIDTDQLIAVDTVTGEIIEDNEDINLRLAQIKASKPLYKDKDFIQLSLGGDIRTYDVKNNKFTKNPSSPSSSRRDFVKEIANAKTPQELIAISKAASEAQFNGSISNEDLIKISGYINQKRASLAEETPDVSDVNASVKGAVSFETEKSKRQIQKQNKTIEQIEEEAKQKKIVSRQTKDAWDAIPDDLKIKLVNDGTTLRLSYFIQRGETVFKNNVVTISMSNREGLIKALTQVNMAAKAGNLKVLEIAKPMEKDGIAIIRENEKDARRWLAKNLPSLSSEERTQFVNKLAERGEDANKLWGSYRSGVIQIQRNAPMGTVYHEAFHYVLDVVLSPEERKAIIDIAKSEYDIADGMTAEERLANDFRRYSLDENATGIIGKIKRWFRIIKDKITRYNRISDATINQLFWKINNGELAEKSEMLESFEDNQQRILEEIRNIQNEKTAWRNLSAETQSAFKDSGLTEDKYNQMSLEEKEQYIRCRG